MTERPIDPAEVREWEEDASYVEAVKEGLDEDAAKASADAILVGIRFIHDYAKTPEGEAEVMAALRAGFFHTMPGLDEDSSVYAVPRLIWPDPFYEKLYPGQSFSGSFGIQVGRRMLWGPPGLIDSRPRRERKNAPLTRAIEEALRRFKRERAH